LKGIRSSKFFINLIGCRLTPRHGRCKRRSRNMIEHLCVSHPHTPSAIIRSGCSTYPRHVSTNAACCAPSTTRWSADQLMPNLSLPSHSPFPSPRSTSHTQRACPRVMTPTPPPDNSNNDLSGSGCTNVTHGKCAAAPRELGSMFLALHHYTHIQIPLAQLPT
jgi:hypothetical protein